MTERRYNEDEVATIFANATETSDSTRIANASAGLTLSELQEIGGEVGLSPEAVAHAAAQLHSTPGVGLQKPAHVTRRLFGLPIAVGSSVELPRKLTDTEWDELVAHLRSTFDARGRVRSEGGWREWRNGNLRATLDRTETGERFTLKTMKGNAFPWLWGGVIAFGGAAALFSTVLFEIAADPNSELRGIFFLLASGLVAFGTAARSLPAWARMRRLQIDSVITRLLAK